MLSLHNKPAALSDGLDTEAISEDIYGESTARTVQRD